MARTRAAPGGGRWGSRIGCGGGPPNISPGWARRRAAATPGSNRGGGRWRPWFGTVHRSYGSQRVRYRGLARPTTELWFKLLADNLRRADRVLAGPTARPSALLRAQYSKVSPGGLNPPVGRC